MTDQERQDQDYENCSVGERRLGEYYILKELESLTQKTNSAHNGIFQKIRGLEEQIKENTRMIRKLENQMSHYKGGIGVLIAIGAAAWALIIEFNEKIFGI